MVHKEIKTRCLVLPLYQGTVFFEVEDKSLHCTSLHWTSIFANLHHTALQWSKLQCTDLYWNLQCNALHFTALSYTVSHVHSANHFMHCTENNYKLTFRETGPTLTQWQSPCHCDSYLHLFWKNVPLQKMTNFENSWEGNKRHIIR